MKEQALKLVHKGYYFVVSEESILVTAFLSADIFLVENINFGSNSGEIFCINRTFNTGLKPLDGAKFFHTLRGN